MPLSTLLLSVFVFGLLIVAHELGHFGVAKGVGVKVHEFSIGMGPLLWSKKRGETLYSIRLLPIGGFNRMAGMEPGDLDEAHGFNRKTVGQRMGVIVAGSVMNFILAALLFFIIFLVIGIPSSSNVIGRVLPDRPAAEAGLEAGDKIVSIDGQRIDNWVNLVDIIHDSPGQGLVLTVERKRETRQITVTPELDARAGAGLIGIEQSWERHGLFTSLWLGITQTGKVTVAIIDGLAKMIGGRVAAELAGPIGIVQMVGEAARFGFGSVLGFAALLSINLGLINLLPIPALDGSRLIFLTIEGVWGRPVDPAKESFVHFIGFFILMLFMVLITFQDITRIFGG